MAVFIKIFRPTLLTIALFTGCTVSSQNTAVTCRTENTVVGDPTFITCNFHKHLNGSKPGVNVVRYPLLSTDVNKGRDVLRCVWSDSADKPECIVDESYQFDYQISDQLTLKIPAATDKVAGLYICYVIPQGDFQSNACDLIVGAKGAVTPTPARTNGFKELTTERTYSFEPCYQTENCDWVTSVLVTTACIAIIVALVITLMVSRRMNSRHLAERSRLENEDQNSAGILLFSTPRIYRESDFHDSTTDSDAQTDFSSNQPIAGNELSDNPPMSLHSRVPLRSNSRKRGMW